MSNMIVNKSDIEIVAKKLAQVDSSFAPEEKAVLQATFGLAKKALQEHQGSVEVQTVRTASGKPASLSEGFLNAFAPGVGEGGTGGLPNDPGIHIDVKITGSIRN